MDLVLGIVLEAKLCLITKEIWYLLQMHLFPDFKVLCLGLIQSLFEGSMYVFVLEWTPALTPDEHDKQDENEGHRGSIPHGHIFAGFMVSKK